MNVLSLGAGVQSSVLALMSAALEIPPYDCAIFADTQAEPAGVYEWLDWLALRLPFPVHRSLLLLETAPLADAPGRQQVNMFNNECEGMCGV